MTITTSPKLNSKHFILSSRKAIMLRVGELITAEGGTVTHRADPQADFFVEEVTKYRPNTQTLKRVEKLNTEKGANIEFVDLEKIYSMIEPTREEVLALLRGSDDDRKRLLWLLGFGPNTPRPYGNRKKVRVDLSGEDLRGVELKNMSLGLFDLTGADFRDARLESVTFSNLVDVRFEGATLDRVTVQGCRGCDFSGAILKAGSFSGTVEKSTFQGAKLSETVFQYANLVECELDEIEMEHGRLSGLTGKLTARNAKFHNTIWSGARLASSDFSGADFSKADLQRADLTGATLTNVDFTRADLVGVNFTKANLDGANFRHAHLGEANLGSASVAKTDFREAYLFGAILPKRGKSNALGLEQAVRALPKPGPKLQELQQRFGKGGYFNTSALLDVEGIGTLQVRIHTYSAAHSVSVFVSTPTQPNRRLNSKNLESSFLELPRRWPNASLRPGSIICSSEENLIASVWCEVFGLEEHTRKQRLVIQEKDRDEAVATLREEGVEKWNAMPNYVREGIRKFHEQDMTERDLYGVNLARTHWVDGRFDGADLREGTLTSFRGDGGSFRRAKLDKVSGNHASFLGADFEGASLVQANLYGAAFRDAKFANADLTKANFSGGNLCGADLRSANLEGAIFRRTSYDEQTQFPEDWTKPVGMKFVGLRLPPETVTGEHEPFRKFLGRLRDYTQVSRLMRAFRMLRFDHFQLFSEVGTETLRGVVRSQGDASSVYSCYLNANGEYGCLAQSTRCCGGLSGKSMCKHLLVLLIGLAKAEKLELDTLEAWIKKAKGKKHVLNRAKLCETFLKYKGAEAGEIDWRPVDTIPEDYYAS